MWLKSLGRGGRGRVDRAFKGMYRCSRTSFRKIVHELSNRKVVKRSRARRGRPFWQQVALAQPGRVGEPMRLRCQCVEPRLRISSSGNDRPA